MTTNFDFNHGTDDEQRNFTVIPANTVVTLQVNIKPGGAGDGGWLTRAKDGKSEHLNCEFTVVDGEYAKRKVFARLTLQGTTEGHADSSHISRNTIRYIIESARGILPKDESAAAQEKRRLAGWQEFEGLRFMARLGVRPARDGYDAQNTIIEVITPERTTWKQPEQGPASTAAPATTAAPAPASAPANTIARPQWSE
jgi:hypothetical protein